MASIINSTTTAGVTVTGDNSGSLQLATNNGTTAVTIDTSQNVGIGTTSPAFKTEIVGGATTVETTLLQIRSNAGGTNTGTTIALANSTNTTAGSGRVELAALRDTASGSSFVIRTADSSGTIQNRVRVDETGLFQFNSGFGSVATAYGCRAWVNFNGSGGVTIRGSGNVTSVTRSSGGVYFVSFTNNMPDANFCFNGSASVSSGNFGLVAGDDISDRTVSRTGTFYTVNTASVNNAADANNINIAIFR